MTQDTGDGRPQTRQADAPNQSTQIAAPAAGQVTAARRRISPPAWIARLSERLPNGRYKQVLPPPVVARIGEQEWSSELLMRIIQLGIVSAFGLLYLLSPPTAGTGVSLVPYILVIYLTLTLIGLAWSWRMRLPDWASYGSIVFDISLLMLLMWSFHQQYDQPTSFYLKAPTFLYLFIFIALRALRFDPKFVLVTGAAAIAGWVFMVGIVLVTDETGTIVTRDYVRYLTSNSLLVGAEVDKLISVALVTAVLYVTLYRGRALLVQAVSQSVAAANLSRFFDESVASKIKAADDVLSQSVRRQAAVLFVDLRGFTELAGRLEPQQVMDILGAYQHRVISIVRTQGGVIDKFMGDGIMATFGATEESPAYAADALRAVDAIIADSSTWQSDAGALSLLPAGSVAAAATAGTVIFGTVGDESRLEMTVIGPAVNLAAKLEKLNKAIGCRALTTTEAYDVACEQGYSAARSGPSLSWAVEGIGERDLVVLHGRI